MDVAVREAPQEDTEHGRKAAGEGWYVLNARDACSHDRVDRAPVSNLEASQDSAQVGLNLFVPNPRNPISMHHSQAHQDDYLVVSGNAVLIAEPEQRPPKQWHFVHCP